MTVISLELRTAIVCAGSPSCQRKLFGAANSKWPFACSGCLRVLRLRVWVKSAVQVLRFDCAASQEFRKAFVSCANTGKLNRRKQRERRREARYELGAIEALSGQWKVAASRA